jgi:hypothetical protein
MAKTAAPAPKSTEAHPVDVAPKAAAVAKKMANLRAELALAHDLAHQAQVREALTRSELTLALGEALKARAQAIAAAGREALAGWAPRAKRPPQPPGRTSQRLLLRLGVSGEVRIIADSRLWRGGDLADISAYVRRRTDPAAAPKALFDQAWYLGTQPDAAGFGRSPLVHYLTRGMAVDAAPHPLFDPVFYRRGNAAELGAVSPLAHFVHAGAWQGHNPHPLFDLAHYAAQRPDLAADEDPVSHYVRKGWRDGLSPHPLFDPAWYRSQAPRQAAEAAPLVHYLTEGWRQGLSPHLLFDSKWYLEHNEDIAAAGLEPLTHYLGGGAAEGRDPSPWFDNAHYLASRGADLNADRNPLVDYLQGGAWAVAESRPGFPTAAYLAQSPELVLQGLTPLEHWARKAPKA